MCVCAGVLEGLQSANWKERLTSMERLLEQVHAMKENLNGSASALVQSMSYLPGWSEKNFQVGSMAQKGCVPLWADGLDSATSSQQAAALMLYAGEPIFGP